MPQLASLEIRIHLQEANRLHVACQFTAANNEADDGQALEGLGGIFTEAAFIGLLADVTLYGQALSELVFADPKVSAFCTKIFSDAMSPQGMRSGPVRLRIAIAASAGVLHGLHWEKLLHPTLGTSLAKADYVVFSRFTIHSDWRMSGPRRRNNLRALICVADQVNGEGGQAPLFDPIDVDSFTRAAQAYLAGTDTQTIGTARDATRKNLREALAMGVDVLFAVCHGHVDRTGESRLVLHADDGTADYVSSAELSQLFRELLVVPRLAIVVSCGSAGANLPGGQTHALHIVPRLAEVGVACVIGFNGDVAVARAQEFCAALFDRLRTDADIEKAVRDARRMMGDTAWWSPVLLTRLRSGALWYEPGFGRGPAGEDGDSKDFWPDVVQSTIDAEITPIVGPDVKNSLLGSRRELALRWAMENGYPIVPGGNDSLPQIAQYLSTMRRRVHPISMAIRFAYQQLCRTGAAKSLIGNPPLQECISGIDDIVRNNLVKAWQEPDTLEPYRAIARLNAKVFITLDWTDHLYNALLAQEKEPIVIVPWYWQDSLMRGGEPSDLARQVDELRANANQKPSVKRPILYYTFGRLAEDHRSLAMSEDDHFDALIELSRDNDMFPNSVRRTLCGSNLLFIGCNLQEWNFRVLLRLIVSRAGFNSGSNYRHVAANIGPEDTELYDVERARAYLKKYLTRAHIELYTGTATDFLSDLSDRLNQGGHGRL